jgi:DNA-binding transcriptional ArsR family regulator
MGIMPSNPKSRGFKSEDVAFAVGSVRRWRVFKELAKGEPLPVSEIARRAGFSPNAASKILLRLRKSGLLECPYGLYRLPDALIVPGEPVLDFGWIVLRLDQPPAGSKG